LIRFFMALLVLVAGAAGGFLVYRHVTAGPSVSLPAPSRLEVTADGTPLLPGGWASSSLVSLSAMLPPRLVAGIDVEVRPLNQPFNGTPTYSTSDPADIAANCPPSASCPVSRRGAPVLATLRDGPYHWRIRFHNKDGISPWVLYKGVLRVDTTPPVVPAVSSSTNPAPTKTYHSSKLRFAWQDSDAGSGLAGYSYRLDTLAGLDTGTYYFHVRALDRAGNWGPVATFPAHVDVTPPGLAHVRFDRFYIDPEFDKLHISFAVTRPATLVRVGVYRQSDQQLVRLYRLAPKTKGHIITVAWDGRDAVGQRATPGKYEVYIRAIDPYGHSSLTGWEDFVVAYRRILVSLSQQRLWAYDGNTLVVTSLVTTGNRALPTPTGVFHIEAKFHPFTFKSPWPKSSPYWYPPSLTQYAMLFQQDGYYIHDAPWRAAFGPGTNSQLGTPGNNYTGTHGCINVPSNVAYQLFQWARIGTVVQVVK
jgi:lipoprotein-anchoring transpeptidase ErfK/SrfK